MTGHVDVIEVQPINEVDADDLWEKIIDENNRIKESAANFPKVQEGPLRSILKNENSTKNKDSKTFLDGSLQTQQASVSAKQHARRYKTLRSTTIIFIFNIIALKYGSENMASFLVWSSIASDEQTCLESFAKTEQRSFCGQISLICFFLTNLYRSFNIESAVMPLKLHTWLWASNFLEAKELLTAVKRKKKVNTF